MKGNKHSRPNKAHSNRVFKLCPTTRAIRAVLGGSATLLALALTGNGAAYAGTCDTAAVDTVYCDGAFTETLPGSLFVPPADMTLVLGAEAPTSVITANGAIGIEAIWSGRIGVISHADISTVGADGVFVYGSSAGSGATFNNDGSVTTSVTAVGANAVDISAYADVNVINGGDLSAHGTGSFDVTTVTAYSVSGVATVDNLAAGTINATATDGNALAINAFGFYGSIVNNDGAIFSSSVNGAATGVFVESFADLVGGGFGQVSNGGSIDVSSAYSQAVGIRAYTGSTSATISNAGSINATGYDLAVGISTDVSKSTTIDNAGSIAAAASVGDAFGIAAESDWDTINIANSGDISAIAGNEAAGILSAGYRGYIDNSGSVLAISTNGNATAIAARDYYSSSVSNSGALQAISQAYDAVGVEAASALLADVNNSGSITVSGASNATGVIASSLFGTDVDNTGTITVNADSGDAAGVIGEVWGGPYAYENLIVDNAGDISATSSYGNAVGIQLRADLPFAVVYNAGNVSAVSGQGTATGISVSTDASISSSYVFTSGTVDAAANGEHGVAVGIHSYANDGDAFVIASGSVSVVSGLSGTSDGIVALSQNGSSLVRNSGDITVATTPIDVAVFTTDLDFAKGIYASSEDSSTVTNTGDITVTGGWRADGIVVRADDGLASVTNGVDGTITVTGSRSATGISTATIPFGDPYTNAAVIDNAGSISVRTTGAIVNSYGESFGYNAIGIDAFLVGGDSVAITNSGSIAVQGSSGTKAIRGVAIGDVTIANSGSIAVTASTKDSSFGIEGFSFDTDVNLSNSGEIRILSSGGAGADWAAGMDAQTFSGPDGGDATVLNTGDIIILNTHTARGMRGNATQGPGVHGIGNITMTNAGNITLVAQGDAWGIDTDLFRVGDTVSDNSGTISVTGTDARGIRAGGPGTGQTTITNSGDIDVIGISPLNPYGYAYGTVGIFTRRYGSGAGGAVTIDNTGSISSVADIGNSNTGALGAHARGIQVFVYGNAIDVSNAGSIVADFTAKGTVAGYALGIITKNGYGTSFADTTISNTGTIETSVQSNDRITPFTFVDYTGALASGIQAHATYGDVAIANAGAINVSALSDYHADAGLTQANGILAVSKVGTSGVERDFDLGDLVVANAATGDIRAYSQANLGESSNNATGLGARVRVGTYGSLLVSEGHGISIDNAGLVSAVALQGTANATGISAVNGSALGFANVGNAGRLNAQATTTGTATAIGVFATAADISVSLDAASVVTATATGADGTAAGLSLAGETVTASNAGLLQSEFIGAGGDTFGALITSPGALSFSNSGIVNATDADLAVGVQLDSLIATTLINSGTINAFSDGAGIAVRTGDSTDLIQNSGTLNGALFTGGGNDALANALGGLWHATGSSDFGSGDDSITNAGTIFVDSASITLGDSLGFNNSFGNGGLIVVSGDNLIQMGASNTSAFSNTGVISFQDGAPDDVLNIVGDFTGNGAVNLDVSALNGTSDLLYINGNVVDNSVNTINVNVLDLPTSTSSSAIDMVRVSGTSRAGNFVLGQVNYDPNQSFLTLDFSLLASIDASNATNDAFSLGVNASAPPVDPPVPPVNPPVPPVNPPVPPVNPPVPPVDPEAPGGLVLVSGLSDSGTLAAAIAPGVQSLVGAQVGTWRQRMGVIDKITQGGVNLWVRLFQNDGTVNPQHHADNFGQGGNFAYDQKNSGTEVGVDFAVSDAFSVGLLLAKSEASQDLTGRGRGSSGLDGDTVGAYATWISEGFYVDASYRRMGFDARLRTTSGEIRTSGDADALNLEAGYAWTFANGLKLEPQVQYTRVQVDGIDALPGALAQFKSEGGDSSLGRLGVALRKSFQSGSASFTPYVAVSALREFDGSNSFSINDDFTGGTSVEGSSALVEGGLNIDLGKLSLFGGANWQDGGAVESNVSGQVGVRYTW